MRGLSSDVGRSGATMEAHERTVDMRMRGAVLLGGAGLVVALALGVGFVAASAGLADQQGQPVGVRPVSVDGPAAPTAPATDAPPPAPPTGIALVPEPTPVPVDDHGGDRPGKGGDDTSGSGSGGSSSGGSGSSGSGSGSGGSGGGSDD